jgi:hypothetical protein
MAEAMRARDIVPECECFDLGIVRSIQMFETVGILKRVRSDACISLYTYDRYILRPHSLFRSVFNISRGLLNIDIRFVYHYGRLFHSQSSLTRYLL